MKTNTVSATWHKIAGCFSKRSDPELNPNTSPPQNHETIFGIWLLKFIICTNKNETQVYIAG